MSDTLYRWEVVIELITGKVNTERYVFEKDARDMAKRHYQLPLVARVQVREIER